MTVTVETPEGERSASGVIGVKAIPVGLMKRSDGRSFPVTGEAVPLFLPQAAGGKGRWLIVTLSRYEEAGTLPATAYAEALNEMGARSVHINPVARYDWLSMMKDLVGLPPVELKQEDMPLLVMLEDARKPTEVEKVDPTDLASTFGSGHMLRSITIEVVDEEPTIGLLEAALGQDFFQKRGRVRREALKRNGLSDPYFDSLSSKLNRDSFKRGPK